MVEPIPQWNPSLLRQIGFGFCVTAIIVLGTNRIPNLQNNPRARFLIVASSTVLMINGITQYPTVIRIVSGIVAAGAVFIPLAICVQAYRIIVSTN